MSDRDRFVSLPVLLVALTAVPNVVASAYLLYVAARSSKFWEVSVQPLASALLSAAAVLGGSAVVMAVISNSRFAAPFTACYACGLLALLAIDAPADLPHDWALSSLLPYLWFFPARTVSVAMAAWLLLLLAAILSAARRRKTASR